MTILDSKIYKEDEGKSWDSVANNWRKWCKTLEIGADKVSRRLIELAGIRPDSRVLDFARDKGEPYIAAANLVGKSGHLLATDISPQMLSFAKQSSSSNFKSDFSIRNSMILAVSLSVEYVITISLD